MTPKFKRVQISKGVILKSGLEEVVFKYLIKNKCLFKYEGTKITYTSPEIKKTYTPDFPIHDSFIIETKGNFNSADRKKMKLIKKQNPNLDIRFIFSNSRARISKKSKTTYGMWCERYGYKYADKHVPKEWL